MAISSWTNYAITDLTRKQSSPTPTYGSLNFGQHGSFKVYMDISTYCYPDGTSFSPQLKINTYYVGTGINSSGSYQYSSRAGELAIKEKIELSTDDFATIAYSEEKVRRNQSSLHGHYWGKSEWYQGEGLYYTRNEDGTRSQYGTIDVPSGYRCDSFGFLFAIPSSVQGRSFKVRLSVAYEHLTDAEQYWSQYYTARTFETYGAFQLSITPPSTVVANGLNEFTASIAAAYESEISTSGLLGCAPVRNQNAPYITSGTATTKIYWVTTDTRGTQSVGASAGRYYVYVVLSITDPSDSSQKIRVGYGCVTGTAYYQQNDDTSMVTASVSFADSLSYYNQYGLLLRNVGSVLNANITFTTSYGAVVAIRIQEFGESGDTLIYSGKDASKTVTYGQQVPSSGNSCSTQVRVRLGTSGTAAIIATGSFSSNIADYYNPTFPTLAIHRCDSSGELNDNGSYCKIEWSVSIAPINNLNSKKLTISHPQGTQTYNPLSSYTQVGVLIVAASPEQAHAITFTVTDDIGSYTRTLRLSTALTTMDLLYEGKGVAFGKVAEQQYAVEIGETWEFIAYQMMLNGIDVEAWMKDIAVRLRGIEEFASNIPDTGQFEVSFYNDEELMDRQWVRYGEDASTPNGGTPERAPTKQYTFAFVGWALVKDATASNPNALSNITETREIYAAYSRATRAYYVEYYNGTTLLERKTDIQYGSSSSRSGTPSGDGTFFDYVPKPSFVDENMKVFARYYTTGEISDSWDTILRKCFEKTAGDTYKIGQHKPLTLTNGTTVNMRLMAIREDTISGLEKAELTWVADGSTGLSSAYNSVGTVNPIYHDVRGGAFTFTKSASQFKAKWSNRILGKAKCKFTIVADETSDTSYYSHFNYGGYAPMGVKVKVWVDGVLEYDYNGVTQNFNAGSTGPHLDPGESVTFEIEYEFVDSSVLFTSTSMYFTVSANYYGSVIDVKNSYVSANDNVAQRYIHYYENGKGNVGGWEYSALRTYLKNTVLPLIPQNVRDNIKTVQKASRARISSVEDSYSIKDATISVQTIVVQDMLWVPSRKEISGAHATDLYGYAEYGYAGSSSPSASGGWERDTTETGNTNALTVSSDAAVTGSKNVWLGFCT